jgi:hypothetical protein
MSNETPIIDHVLKTVRWSAVAWVIHAIIIAIAVDQLTQMRCRKLEHDVADLQRSVWVIGRKVFHHE